MKKNKILVATNHLETVGGSEMYTYDLIKSLHLRSDCDVEYFTFEKGEVSEKIEELGVSFMEEENYDLILANHVPVVEHLYTMGPIVQICHGIAPALEQPSAYADFHVAISEEVNLHLKSKNVSDSTVILNGLDLEQKRIEIPVGRRLRKVLSLCQSESANKIIEEICEEEGWFF